ncbi:MAG: hypothetical protein WDZ88_00715 [Candidatus Paceibacterota bacterium]
MQTQKKEQIPVQFVGDEEEKFIPIKGLGLCTLGEVLHLDPRLLENRSVVSMPCGQ